MADILAAHPAAQTSGMRVNDVYRGKRRKPRLLSPAESKGLAPNAASDRYYEIYTRPLFHKDGREFSAAA